MKSHDKLAFVATVAAALLLAIAPAHAGPMYQRYKKITHANTCVGSNGSHNVPCCSVDGLDRTGDDVHHPACPTMFDIVRENYSCSTNAQQPSIGAVAQNCCACGPTDQRCSGGVDLNTLVDGAIIPDAYQCDRNDDGQKPEQCDGKSSGTVPVDQGCQADEHSCNIGDSDNAPVRYSSGRVESNPIELFRVPTPGDILFGYRITYNSQANRSAARRNTVNAVHDTLPVIHRSQEDTHYIGLGWLDNFSDRLYVTAPNTPSTQITWNSQNGTVTFIKSGGLWKSWSGKFELIDRGASPPDGLGRWVVRSVDTSAPRQIWA